MILLKCIIGAMAIFPLAFCSLTLSQSPQKLHNYVTEALDSYQISSNLSPESLSILHAIKERSETSAPLLCYICKNHRSSQRIESNKSDPEFWDKLPLTLLTDSPELAASKHCK